MIKKASLCVCCGFQLVGELTVPFPTIIVSGNHQVAIPSYVDAYLLKANSPRGLEKALFGVGCGGWGGIR